MILFQKFKNKLYIVNTSQCTSQLTRQGLIEVDHIKTFKIICRTESQTALAK